MHNLKPFTCQIELDIAHYASSHYITCALFRAKAKIDSGFQFYYHSYKGKEEPVKE